MNLKMVVCKRIDNNTLEKPIIDTKIDKSYENTNMSTYFRK